MTQERLKELVYYDSHSGIFTRRIVLNNNTKIGDKIGTKTSHGYLSACVSKEKHYMHRLAWLYVYGVMPEQIDHINHNRMDNSIINLRNVTHSENHKNMSLYKRNKSGKHGVTWDKERNRWGARITFNGKIKTLGRYKKLDDALMAREKAEKDVWFYINHGQKKCC